MSRLFPLMALSAACMACFASLTACYPTFNWREVRPEGTALSLLLPCKPEKAQKILPIGGKPIPLTLLGCDAGDITFAVAEVSLANPQDVAPVLEQWQGATLVNMKVGTAAPGSAASSFMLIKIAGASTQPPALLVRARGHRADGRPVSGHAAYFAHGSQAFQAVMYADNIPQDVAETFFSSLKFE